MKTTKKSGVQEYSVFRHRRGGRGDSTWPHLRKILSYYKKKLKEQYVTRWEKRDLGSKTENLHGEWLKNRAAALNTFKDSFLIIDILWNNVDKKFVISPHERSVQKITESRLIRKSMFWIVGPVSRIASHI